MYERNCLNNTHLFKQQIVLIMRAVIVLNFVFSQFINSIPEISAENYLQFNIIFKEIMNMFVVLFQALILFRITC